MEDRLVSCYEEWLREQDSDVRELTAARSRGGDDGLRALVERCLVCYQDYAGRRRALAMEDGPTLLCPPWCTTLESSLLWIGGCRPTVAIRLLYSLAGSQVEAHLSDLLAGRGPSGEKGGSLVVLSAQQLELVDKLHRRTVLEEDQLSSRMASLQEDVADSWAPLRPAGRDRNEGSSSSGGGSGAAKDGVSGCGELEEAVERHVAAAAAGMVEEADKLRVKTVRALVTEILTPAQAAELLVAAKQLHLCVHELGQRRDSQHRQG